MQRRTPTLNQRQISPAAPASQAPEATPPESAPPAGQQAPASSPIAAAASSPAWSSRMLGGKGYFIWRVTQLLSRPGLHTPAAAARQAREAGIEHAIIKIADGEDPYPLPLGDKDGKQETATAALIDALRQAGINVWGWAFAYGDPVDPEKQAATFATRARYFGLNGLVVNAEDLGNRRWSSPGGADGARSYMTTLRQDLEDVDGLLLAFSSYRYLRYHPSFPFAAFLEGCDIVMPQVYWVAHGEGDAIYNLRRSYEDYQREFPDKLYVPIGAAYGEYYGQNPDRYFWSASPRQIYRFMDQSRAMGLPAVSFWSWEHALYDEGNQTYNGSELWDAVASYHYTDAGSGKGGAGTTEEVEPIEIRIDEEGYRSGVYARFPYAAFIPMVRDGQKMAYARTVGKTPSSVWAWWRPDIEADGEYEISVWIPGQNATTRRAQYQIHGVVGEKEPVIVYLNQYRFSDTWVSLGVFELDAENPQSGQVNLTNHTGEEKKRIAFAGVRWQKVAVPNPAAQRLADGFDAPVGTPGEREATDLWPGQWHDANPYGNYYKLRNSYNYHTGADLNLNKPHYDADRGKPVYAIASGIVTFAGRRRNWGRIVIIRHDPPAPGEGHVYARYAHLGDYQVEYGQRVQRSQQIGTVGQDEHNGPFHLHFDISPTEILYNNPADWPGLDRSRIYRDYIDPKEYIQARRPARPGTNGDR